MNFEGFLGPAYLARSADADAEQCINLYPERDDGKPGGPVSALYGTPGLARVAVLPTASGGHGRGMWGTAGGRVFCVCGDSLYELFSGGTFLLRGLLASGDGAVSMADNGLELIIVDGGEGTGWLLTLATNALVAIASPGFYGANTVVFLDGYFVLNRPGTDQFYISGLLDGATYDATEFASAEGHPDPIRALLVSHRELLIFGSQTIQPFFNSANVNFPFEPMPGILIEMGIAAAASAAIIDNTAFWLGSDARGQGMVWRLQGYIPQRISTHAIEYAINQYPKIDDAVAYAYQEEGHAFYALTFPSGNATWVYDVATGLWHQRASLDPTTGQQTYHAAMYHCVGFGLHLVCGHKDGRVYAAGLQTYTDDGQAIVRDRVTRHVTNDEKLLYYATFELRMERGIGVDGGAIPGTDPQVMLRWSNDGGHTWSPERWASVGAEGQYKQRVLFRRLGRSRTRTFHVRISDPVRVALLGARVEVTT